MVLDLRYPIGRFRFDASDSSDSVRQSHIGEIAQLPLDLRASVDGLSDAQLDTPYRPEGWTVRQVTHHVPDSHMNAYIRFKLALTEDVPVIKPYAEAAWADLGDSLLPVGVSLDLLEALHSRWVSLLAVIDESGWKRTFRHPEAGRVMSLEEALAMYAWHGRHHVRHITLLREDQGW
jgi:hypothetical protein